MAIKRLSSDDHADGTLVNLGNVGIGTTSPGAALDVKGTLRLSGSTSGYVGFSVPANAGSATYTLPASAPAATGYVLSSTTAGIMSWVAAGSGTIGFSSNMLGNYVTPLGYGNIPADLSYNNVVNATDGLYFLRLAGVVQASTTGFLEANLTPAYGSTYGTKKVGLGFSVGTNSQALRVGAGLSDQGYMNNVNGVIFGYMGSGPRIIASDYDFDDDTPNTIRIVASETYFPVGLVGIGTTSPGY